MRISRCMPLRSAWWRCSSCPPSRRPADRHVHPTSDAVTDWNVNAVNALVGTAGQSPTVSTVHLAMVHGAVYDAVNSIDERYEPYLVHVRARDWYSQDAAAATAAYRVLLALVPAQQPALGAAVRRVARLDPGRRGEAGRHPHR